MFPRSYYAVLRLPEDADPAAIRHAYRTLVRRFHPDAGIGSSAQKFREVTEAYDVLSDPQRRQVHDVDLARSRADFRVQPEPLIPQTPTHGVFRPFHLPPEPLIPETPRRVVPSAFGFDQEMARMVQIMENAFGQIW
jgi:curved DNA-binding protein CbpA